MVTCFPAKKVTERYNLQAEAIKGCSRKLYTIETSMVHSECCITPQNRKSKGVKKRSNLACSFSWTLKQYLTQLLN